MRSSPDVRVLLGLTKLTTAALLLAVLCQRTETAHVSAQAVGPGPLSRVSASGLCSGSGTSSNPLVCSVSVDGSTVTGTGSAGSPLSLNTAAQSFSFGLMGDGSDGTFTFDGVTTFVDRRGVSHVPVSNVYTQTNDIFCDGCTINAGVSVRPSGFRFYDRGTLTLNGKIERNGNAASGVTGGASVGCSTCYYPNGGTAGGNGGAGGAAACAAGTATGTAAQASGAAGLTCSNSGGTAGAPGVNGGSCKGGGGGNGGDGTACAGGTVTLTSLSNTNFRMWVEQIAARVSRSATSTTTINGGSGGGGGRGASTPTAYGGGGGGGGGYLVVFAKKIVGSGSIEAKGGAGANGEVTNNTGGGGGGAGGIVIVTLASGSCPTISVTGGAGGLGNGTGANGGNGGSGLSRCVVMQ